MPTITGAIIQAAAFQATSGPSTLQALTATTAGLTGLLTSTMAGESIKMVPTASGTYGTAKFMQWYRSNGSTSRAYFGYGAGDDQNFDISTQEAGGIVRIQSGAGVTAITVASNQAVTFAAGITATTVTTSAPTGGAGTWKLGIANAVSPTAPNRTVTIDIGGTLIYLHGKTTND